MKKIIFTKEIINEIISFYTQPESLNATAKHFKYNRGTIKNILIKNNISLHTEQEYNDLGSKKRKDYNINLYGESNFFKTTIFKEKSKQTCLEHFGVEHSFQSESVNKKARQTKIAKYNDANFNNRKKAQKTCLEKFGCQTPAQNVDVLKKMQDTCTSKYGVNNYSFTIEFAKQHKSSYKLNGINFDSLPELALYLYAKDHSENIIRMPVKFEYEFEGSLHYYFPDFKYKDKLIEIKGDHFFNENGTMCNPFDHSQDALYEAKHQCMLKNNVEIWTSKDYQFAIDYINIEYIKKDNIIWNN